VNFYNLPPEVVHIADELTAFYKTQVAALRNVPVGETVTLYSYAYGEEGKRDFRRTAAFLLPVTSSVAGMTRPTIEQVVRHGYYASAADALAVAIGKSEIEVANAARELTYHQKRRAELLALRAR